MPLYSAPLRDLKFSLNEIFDVYNVFKAIPEYAETTSDLGEAILQEAGKFCEEVLAPLNQVGDQQGCTWNDGVVTTPEGFKEAYKQYVELGFPSLDQDPEYGGQGLPHSIGIAMRELLGTSNWSWSMYPGLSHGCMNTIHMHGTDDQKNTYLPKLISGEWTGTMCLTESHCGTDLGMLRTKAEPKEDGSYALSGTKIFISSGEHDMSDNIVHIVLARLPDAPEGTRGISLFIVPKFIPDADGNPSERNSVNCGSLEHKMGIHGNATCVMNFDGATGYLIGPPNKGLNCMFTFMNVARIGTGLQGTAHAEFAFQNSLAYALDRVQMRSLSGTKNPESPADKIIVHPDVRRMLLTQKAFAEGGRIFGSFLGMLVDKMTKHPDEAERQKADTLMELLTPIFKGCMTELGFEAANLGVQCFGGHGYIAEWGVEQNVRDSRISMLYEGTTGIQALDLLGRKVLSSHLETLKVFNKEVADLCEANASAEGQIKEQIEALAVLNKEWMDLSGTIGLTAMENVDIVGSASYDYLMYSGYVCLAYFFALSSLTAQKALDAGTDDVEFYKSKLQVAEFYNKRILPRTKTLAETMVGSPDVLLNMEEESFVLGR